MVKIKTSYGNLKDRGSQYTDITIIDHPVVGKMATGGTLGLSPNGQNNVLDETKVRDSEIKTESYDLKIVNEGDLWTSSVHFGYTEGSGGTQTDRSVGWGANTVHSFDTSSVGDIKTHYDLDPADASQWSLQYLGYESGVAKDDESYIQFDFERPIDLAFFSGIKFGAKYRDHSRFNTKHNTARKEDLHWSLADYSLAMPSDYLSGVGSAGTLKNYANTDSAKVRRDGDPIGWDFQTIKASTFEVNEAITAAYIKADIDAEGVRGNVGVRLVYTDQATSSWEGKKGDRQWLTDDSSYFDILPSLNLAVDLQDDLILRMSAARVMSRPDYSQMTSSTTYNIETKTGTGGNPGIDPHRATQFDLGLEWYFSDAGIVSAVVFMKDIQSFIDVQEFQEVFEGKTLTIKRPINSQGGTIQGLRIRLST